MTAEDFYDVLADREREQALHNGSAAGSSGSAAEAARRNEEARRHYLDLAVSGTGKRQRIRIRIGVHACDACMALHRHWGAAKTQDRTPSTARLVMQLRANQHTCD